MGEKYFFILLDSSGQDRLRIRIETTKGGVKYFVVQYETMIDNDWIAIVRYDLAHGFFHRDVMTPKGEKEKQSVERLSFGVEESIWLCGHSHQRTDESKRGGDEI